MPENISLEVEDLRNQEGKLLTVVIIKGMVQEGKVVDNLRASHF